MTGKGRILRPQARAAGGRRTGGDPSRPSPDRPDHDRRNRTLSVTFDAQIAEADRHLAVPAAAQAIRVLCSGQGWRVVRAATDGMASARTTCALSSLGHSAILARTSFVENDGCNSCVVSVELPIVWFLAVQPHIYLGLSGRLSMGGCPRVACAPRLPGAVLRIVGNPAGGRRIREANKPCSHHGRPRRSEPAMINMDAP